MVGHKVAQEITKIESAIHLALRRVLFDSRDLAGLARSMETGLRRYGKPSVI